MQSQTIRCRQALDAVANVVHNPAPKESMRACGARATTAHHPCRLAGDDFPDALTEEIAGSDLMVAVIGTK